MDAEATLASGFAPFAAFALRQDVTERLAAAIRARARAAARFELPVELGAQAGLTREELQTCWPSWAIACARTRRPDGRPGRSSHIADARGTSRTRRRPPGAATSPFAALAALKLAT